MNRKIFFTLICMVAIFSLAVFFRVHNSELLLQGEVDAPQVIVAAKAKGRVVEHLVRRGADVRAGQPLLRLEAPELIAQLDAARQARDQAKSTLEMSQRGTREETIRQLKAQMSSAQASYRNSLDNYNRILRIADKGYASAQELDNARSSRDTAQQAVRQAQANLDQGLHGDRIEQRAIYQAQLDQASQQLKEIQVQADELLVRAPVDGEVGPIPAEVGELMGASSPLLTLIRLQRSWFVFNLREDILAHVRKGDQIKIRVPALNNKIVTAKVYYIAPLGDFSTKSATRATGDFDLKTFEVRLSPVEKVKGLRQGMSALWQWDH